jgi:hypothetical protein
MFRTRIKTGGKTCRDDLVLFPTVESPCFYCWDVLILLDSARHNPSISFGEISVMAREKSLNRGW